MQKILLAVDPFFITKLGGPMEYTWYGQKMNSPEAVTSGHETLHQLYSKLIDKYSKEKGNIFILVYGKSKTGDWHDDWLKTGKEKKISEIRGSYRVFQALADAMLAREAIRKFGEKNVVMIGHSDLKDLPKILAGKGIRVESSARLQVCGGIYSTRKDKPGCVNRYSKQVAGILGLKGKPNILKNATIVGRPGKVIFPWQRSQTGRNMFLRNLFEIKKIYWKQMSASTGVRPKPLVDLTRLSFKKFKAMSFGKDRLAQKTRRRC